MKTLVEKQQQVLRKDEMELINIFNATVQFSNSKKSFSNQEDDFQTKMKLLQSSANGMQLYHKLVTIKNNIGQKFAVKYLNNYLEYHNQTFHSFVSLSNN